MTALFASWIVLPVVAAVAYGILKVLEYMENERD